MTEWNIQGRAHACEACGRNFKDKEVYHTLLFDEKSGFRRSDICDACWKQQDGEGSRERKGFVSYWHGVFEAPPPPSEPIQKQTAESLLREIIKQDDPKYVPVAYILAVMLERKRLLKIKEQMVREGRRVFVYEQPATGDVFTIVDPNLQLNQLEVVQKDVADLLEHGLNPPQPEPVPEQGAAEAAPIEAPPAANEPAA